MARTFRTVPSWVKSEGNSRWSMSKFFQRVARGQDGVIRSEIAQSAKDGKRDDWSTTSKGRANKRRATKQIRAFVKAETAKEMENSDAYSLAEYREAWRENEEIDRLTRAMEWAQNDARFAARDLAYFQERLAEILRYIAEVKGD